MKIRKGFVSNSSSSSFVLIIEKEWFEKCMEESDEYTQYIIDKTYPTDEVILGSDCKILEGWEDGESYLDEIPPHSSEEGDDFLNSLYRRQKAVDQFEKLVAPDKTKFYLHTMDN